MINEKGSLQAATPQESEKGMTGGKNGELTLEVL